MKISDIVTILSIVVAVTAVIGQPQLEAVFPGRGAYLSGVLAIVGLAAGQIIRVLTNKTGAPATAIAANAPIVPADTTVVKPDTPTVAENVTTTTTTPIIAPPKGNVQPL